MCHICKKWRTPIELVTDKVIMPLDGLNISDSPSQIYHPKYTKLETGTIALDDIFHHYLKDSFFEDIIYKNCSSISSETRKATFTVWINFKPSTLVFNILL